MIKQILQLQREERLPDNCKDDYYFEAIVEEYFATSMNKEKEVIKYENQEEDLAYQ